MPDKVMGEMMFYLVWFTLFMALTWLTDIRIETRNWEWTNKSPVTKWLMTITLWACATFTVIVITK